MKNRNWENKVISIIYIVLMVYVIGVCMFFTHFTYAEKLLSENYLPAVLLIVFGTIFLCGVYTIIQSAENKFCLKKWQIYICLIIFYIIQAFFVYSYYFRTDWDVFSLITVSERIAHKENYEFFYGYYSKYPNNLFLLFIISGIMRLANSVGLDWFGYEIVIGVQCALNVISGIILFKCIRLISSKREVAFLASFIYMMMIGLSPWVSIPYSDSMALIFPVLIFYIYLKDTDKKYVWLKWLLIVCLAYVGYKIKPQVFIMLIAIVGIELLQLLRRKYSIKEVAMALGGTFIGLCLAICITSLAINSIDMKIDKERAFGMPHFFMMGMNAQDMGVWSGKDVEFSTQFDTVKERNKANIDEAFNRIKEMKLKGLSTHLVRKTLTNYNDGTFCWSGEGYFFAELKDDTTFISRFLKNLYYTRTVKGKYNDVWSNYCQMLWMTLLFFSIFATRKIKNRKLIVAMLSIIGLSLFELIFEARARYLYIYAPIYILLGVIGFTNLFAKKQISNEGEVIDGMESN